uniref:NADH-ubiquinone oxidoreductase chain 4 n=1 Tax=Tropidocephala brunnipennis TaxID=2008871 RepID=A0A7S4YZK4_9HEMI|nr:NADH dehydrogenase subunit 4 [Tropidocephala brunnipennis]QBZ38051.1 NADH dehydrogenase subunit 4 [Tropidocephala brunnipennis]
MLSLIMLNIFLILIIKFLSLHMLIYIFYLILNYFIWNFYFNSFFCLISFNFGLDKYSFSLMILSIWICLLMMYSSLNYKNFYKLYINLMILLINFFLTMCFFSLNFFFFYLFFECSVLPLFLLIYGWGYQPERVYSSIYFILFTLISSLPLFLLILNLESELGYFYMKINFSCLNFYMMFFFMFSFLVKLPMFMFHLWLPKAHVEAPTLGSMILAGVMLKLGGYGLIRVFNFFNYIMNIYSFIFVSVSLIGCFYISLFCLIQVDLKMLVAYSSVSHMGLIICGLVSLTDFGFLGSLFLMISHGLVSSGMFFLVGCLYERIGSRSIFIIRGLMNFMPSFVMFFFLLCVSNMSCPPSLNLVSEIFIIFSLINWDYFTLIYLFFILFFSACSMICLFSFISHGLSSSMIFYMDSGLVREFLCFFLHLAPLYLFILNLEFFS